MTSSFFNPDDGLTVQALLVSEQRYLTGYFDLIDADYYVDDSAGAKRGEFTCESKGLTNAVVGDKLVIDGTSYRVNNFKPDGSGIAVLTLQHTE